MRYLDGFTDTDREKQIRSSLYKANRRKKVLATKKQKEELGVKDSKKQQIQAKNNRCIALYCDYTNKETFLNVTECMKRSGLLQDGKEYKVSYIRKVAYCWKKKFKERLIKGLEELEISDIELSLKLQEMLEATKEQAFVVSGEIKTVELKDNQARLGAFRLIKESRQHIQSNNTGNVQIVIQQFCPPKPEVTTLTATTVPYKEISG